MIDKNVIKDLYNKNSKISLKNNAASLYLSTTLASATLGAASAALHNILKSESNKSEPEQNIDPVENDPNKPEQNIDSIDDDKSDSDENDPNKNDPNKNDPVITPEPKYEKSLNLLKPILYTSGSVLIYIVLHYVAKSLLFYGVWFKSKGNKPTLYKDIEELKIPGHLETRALIAYAKKYKFGVVNDEGSFEECKDGRECRKHKEHKWIRETISEEKVDEKKRDTIILTFGGNFTEGRDIINRIRVKGKDKKGKVNDEGNFEECDVGWDDCKHKGHKWIYVDGELNYTAASIVPRGYYSNENILKKLGKAGEEALYEDAENLYNYVTGTLGYKNVIIHGFCQGGPVAAHLVKYAEEKAAKDEQGNKVIGLVLSGPMDGVYSSVSNNCSTDLGGNTFGKIVGSISGGISKFLLPFNSLDTYKNLKNIKNKDLPIICLSGKDGDSLSFEKTKIDKRLRDIGFQNVTTGIYEKRGHVTIFKEDFIKITQTEKQVVMKPDIGPRGDIFVTDINGNPMKSIFDLDNNEDSMESISDFNNFNRAVNNQQSQ